MNQPKRKLCAYCGIKRLSLRNTSGLCAGCREDIRFRVETETILERMERKSRNG